MKQASFLVLPSLWYEGFPMVMAESLACGTPVVGSRLGAMQEIITDGRTGLAFQDRTIPKTWPRRSNGPGNIRRNSPPWAGRLVGTTKLSTRPEMNYSLLMAIYQQVIQAQFDAVGQRHPSQLPEASEINT